MTSWRRAFEFFLVVPPVPRLMIYGFTVTMVVAVVAMCADSRLASTAAIPILVLQAFATSSGFASHARRGHYDLLLTGGVGRRRTAVVHLLMSAAPGVVSWGVLALLEMLVLHSTHTLATGAIAVLVAVSTVPWATTVALPRFTGGIAWLMLGVWLLVVNGPVATRVDPERLPSAPSQVRTTVLPFATIGRPTTSSRGQVATLLGAAGLSVAMAIFWIHRTPLALETGQ